MICNLSPALAVKTLTFHSFFFHSDDLLPTHTLWHTIDAYIYSSYTIFFLHFFFPSVESYRVSFECGTQTLGGSLNYAEKTHFHARFFLPSISHTSVEMAFRVDTKRRHYIQPTPTMTTNERTKIVVTFVRIIDFVYSQRHTPLFVLFDKKTKRFATTVNACTETKEYHVMVNHWLLLWIVMAFNHAIYVASLV